MGGIAGVRVHMIAGVTRRYGSGFAALLAMVGVAATTIHCGGDSETGATFNSNSGAGGELGTGGNTNSSASSGVGGSGGELSGSGGDAGGNVGGFGPIGGDRPVSVHVPPGYNPNTPTPLVLLLHGYSASGALQEVYMNFSAQADVRTFLYAYPDGTKDDVGQRFWNATDACCNLFGSTVDDSTYLRNVIDDIKQVFNVDNNRVYLIGHSNGGFMSHRMACDHADSVAAIATLAGATHGDSSLCQPQNPVAVLTIHGTLDPTIAYLGGSLNGSSFPGAIETSQRWAQLNGCSSTADTSPPNINVSGGIIGKETQVRRWDIGCSAHGEVEHWKVVGAQHAPIFAAGFTEMVIDFLYAHPKR